MPQDKAVTNTQLTSAPGFTFGLTERTGRPKVTFAIYLRSITTEGCRPFLTMTAGQLKAMKVRGYIIILVSYWDVRRGDRLIAK